MSSITHRADRGLHRTDYKEITMCHVTLPGIRDGSIGKQVRARALLIILSLSLALLVITCRTVFYTGMTLHLKFPEALSLLIQVPFPTTHTFLVPPSTCTSLTFLQILTYVSYGQARGIQVDQSATLNERRELFRESVHLTPEGTELLAKLFFEKIVELKLVIP